MVLKRFYKVIIGLLQVVFKELSEISLGFITVFNRASHALYMYASFSMQVGLGFNNKLSPRNFLHT